MRVIMSYIVEVNGLSYRNGAQILRNVVKDLGGAWDTSGYQYHELKLTLKPEPENQYDSNAIAVYSEYLTPERARIKRDGLIGYLPKGLNIIIDKPTEVDAIVKEGFGNVYVKVDVSEFMIPDDILNEEYEDDIIENNKEDATQEIEYDIPKIETSTKKKYYYKTMTNKFVFSFLAIFFGIFGIHWFYAKQYSKGLWYLLFSWTSIPMFLGWYQGIKALLTQTDSSYLIEV